jgi:hypothetical protein
VNVVQRRKFLQWWGFGHEFSWHGSQTELPLCHKPESFTDCRRFAPWAESEASDVVSRLHAVRMISTGSIRIASRFAFQSGQFDAVRKT